MGVMMHGVSCGLFFGGTCPAHCPGTEAQGCSIVWQVLLNLRNSAREVREGIPAAPTLPPEAKTVSLRKFLGVPGCLISAQEQPPLTLTLLVRTSVWWKLKSLPPGFLSRSCSFGAPQTTELGLLPAALCLLFCPLQPLPAGGLY